MAADGLGDVDDGLDAAVRGPEIPSFEIAFGLLGRLVEEVLEHQTYLVGASGFQVAASEIEGRQFLFLLRGEVIGILEPKIAGAGKFRMEFDFLPADLIDGRIDEADQVVLVEGEGGVG